MMHSQALRRMSYLAVVLGLVAVPPVVSQIGGTIGDDKRPAEARPLWSGSQLRHLPPLEPIADTRFLMQAINLPNFQGLEYLLKQRPVDANAWAYVKGQALLIAENGNLLILRPSRSQEDRWLDLAATLRSKAARL